MTFSKAEQTLLRKAAKTGEYKSPGMLAWIGAGMVLVGAALMIIGNPDDRENWAFVMVLIAAFGMMVEYTRFRARALSVIHKLQNAADSPIQLSSSTE